LHHILQIIVQKVNQLGHETSPHPPYFPDLSPTKNILNDENKTCGFPELPTQLSHFLLLYANFFGRSRNRITLICKLMVVRGRSPL
jgi:hypothetical protein